MTDIAEESGIGVATLYRYFGTKTSITIAAMTYLWNQMNDMFSEIFESEIFLSAKRYQTDKRPYAYVYSFV